MNIDNEWFKFLTSSKSDNNSYDSDEIESIDLNHLKNDKGEGEIDLNTKTDILAPKSTELYISTKSKISYLNQEIDLKKMFWNIKIIPYDLQTNGVIKKQMKYIFDTPEELEEIQTILKNEDYFQEQIITSINNPNGRIKFKDIRKITIGLSKKDILSYRSKKRGAFYNCFVLIIRHKIEDVYKEYHVKIFNTGKLKIPGVQNEEIFQNILNYIILLLQPFLQDKLFYAKKSVNVLINSNFNCGFYVNLEKLYDILKYNYNIQCVYDPCSYPGLQCKFHHDTCNNKITGEQQNNMTIKESKKSNNNIIISFMIFRTGSILIVGLCEEDILYKVYDFIKNILTKEYSVIYLKNIENENTKNKNKKIKKKIVYLSSSV